MDDLTKSVRISVITSLYNCTKYLQGYFDAVDKIENKTECEFILLHNAPQKEELEIIEQKINGKPWFRHIIINKREGLYFTWNRGIQLSQGTYCAVWNVDDIRFPDSLFLQAKNLEENPNSGLVIGDIYGTDTYGKGSDRYYNNEHIIKNQNELYRSCIITCFPMWKREIHEAIGFFDEQFICAGDFDFQIRVARRYEVEYVNKPLGIYLENTRSKLSNNEMHEIENNIIYLRYGAYEKLVLHKVPAAIKRYSTNSIINFSEATTLTTNGYFTKVHKIIGLFVSFVISPYHLLRSLYHYFKKG